MTKFADWPKWLQAVVVIPHIFLAMVATLLWWPKSKEQRQRFGFVAAYLALFYIIMRYIFNAK